MSYGGRPTELINRVLRIFVAMCLIPLSLKFSKMKKEYRTAIIAGVFAGVTVTLIKRVMQGSFSWTFLILSVIVNPLAIITGLKMREKRERAQRRE